VQNATGTRRRDHIMPVLYELHWVPIREHVKFKVTCLVRQSFGQVPLYVADDCCLVCASTWRSLQSADVPTCVVSQRLCSYSYSGFCSRWTSLELSSGPAAQSRHHLSTVQMTYEGTPFWEARTRRSVNHDMRHLRETLTYLLTYLFCTGTKAISAVYKLDES